MQHFSICCSGDVCHKCAYDLISVAKCFYISSFLTLHHIPYKLKLWFILFACRIRMNYLYSVLPAVSLRKKR